MIAATPLEALILEQTAEAVIYANREGVRGYSTSCFVDGSGEPMLTAAQRQGLSAPDPNHQLSN